MMGFLEADQCSTRTDHSRDARREHPLTQPQLPVSWEKTMFAVGAIIVRTGKGHISKDGDKGFLSSSAVTSDTTTGTRVCRSSIITGIGIQGS